MPHFSERSAKILSDADPRLQDIFNEVILVVDCSILCSFRGEVDQNMAYAAGNSQLQYPKSKHNKLPSLAIDAVPFPLNWSDLNKFYYLAGVVKGIAYKMNIPITWGGSWPTFKDMPHYELGDTI